MAGRAKYIIEKQSPPVTYYWGPEVDRETARSIGLVRFFTGKPCKYGHVAERWVSSGTCIECVLQRHRTPEYREYVRPVNAAWLEANPGKVDQYNEQRRDRRENEPEAAEQMRAASRAWHAEKSKDPEWRAKERERLRKYA
ncbi:hypothetical protein [Salipiger mangrovisoli]|uniref:Uncharacterized protein n=1 Tax=Salipiger mangrovisoli TaxID=2865933 RepID=A0ABR9WZ37_9RHOB|nr:hypothetical protein [Salipiger mangrovisoli]MBE9636552.1 hypothetical protein [Salipiger mangrovisoli]